MSRVVIRLIILSLAALGIAAEGGAPNPWPEVQTPAKGPPRAIGDYSKGCVRGAVPLPLDGPGYQVMRPSRRRYFGHPVLVDYVKTLAAQAHDQADTLLLIGDLGQPRGGRSNGGHSSHQTGLDVDIWFWDPPVAAKGPLSKKQRENMPARSVVAKAKGIIVPRWKDKVTAVLRLAAQDERVARIFVNPIIKRELCAVDDEDRTWLRKLRPWYGHDDHFHVRLECPDGSSQCKSQAPVPEGDGCDALAFWFDEKAQAERRKAQKNYQKNVDEGRGWPEACEPLLQE